MLSCYKLHHVVNYIPSAYLWLEAYAFYLASSNFPLTLTSVNHRSDLSFWEMVCFWSKIDLNPMSFPVTRHSDPIFLYVSHRSAGQLKLLYVPIQGLHGRWLYSLPTFPVPHWFCIWKSVSVNLPHIFSSSCIPLSSCLATTCLFSLSIALFLFCNGYSLFFGLHTQVKSCGICLSLTCFT